MFGLKRLPGGVGEVAGCPGGKDCPHLGGCLNEKVAPVTGGSPIRSSAPALGCSSQEHAGSMRENVPWLGTVSRLEKWAWGEECPNEDCRRLGMFCLREVPDFVGCAN